MLLAVLAHIEGDECIFITEQELSQSLGQLGLTDTGRTGEDKRAAWTLGILEPRAGASNGLRQ